MPLSYTPKSGIVNYAFFFRCGLSIVLLFGFVRSQATVITDSCSVVDLPAALSCSDGAYIFFTEPDDNEGMVAGQPFNFTWNSSDLDWGCRVTILYRVDSDSNSDWDVLPGIPSSGLKDDGSQTLMLPSNINSTNVDFWILYLTPTSSGGYVSDQSLNCTVAPPPSTCSNSSYINITEPDLNDLYIAGEQLPIRWNSDDLGWNCPVAIAYRINGGSNQIITSNTADDGAYNWNIPSHINSNDVKIAVVYTEPDDDGDPVGDVSGTFTISNSCSEGAYINITEPDPGDQVQAGSNLNIQWSSPTQYSSCPVGIGYRVNGGSIITIASSTSDDGSFNWNVPSHLNSNDVEIAIAYLEPTSNGSYVGDDSGSFSVNSSCSEGANINLTFPAGGEALFGGQSYTFTWNSSNLGSSCRVSIVYRVDNGNWQALPGISSSGTSDDGSFTTTLPSSINSTDVDFLIGYVEPDNDGNSVQDFSYNCTVQPLPCSEDASITLTNPAAGDVLSAGQNYTYTWNSSNLSSNCKVILSYRVNGGSYQLVPGMTINGVDDSGSYPATIPAGVNSTDVDFAIAYLTPDSDGNPVRDFSHDCTIQVPSCSQGATMAITAPTAGATLTAGTQYSIQWNSSNLGSACPVAIAYTVDNGTPVIITSSYPDDSPYTWSIPANIDSDNVELAVFYNSGDDPIADVVVISVQPPAAPSLEFSSCLATVTSIEQGQSINVTADLRNPGASTYSGTVTAFLSEIGNNSNNKILYSLPRTVGAGQTVSFNSSSDVINNPPGNYRITVLYSNGPNGNDLVSAGSCTPTATANGTGTVYHYIPLTVTVPTNVPTITVSNPPDTWTVGETRAISWSTVNAPNCTSVTVELERVSTGQLHVLAQNVSASTNFGNFYWNVGYDEDGDLIPNITDTDVRLKVYCTSGNSPVDYSESFQLDAPPPIVLELDQAITLNPSPLVVNQNGSITAKVINNGTTTWTGTLALQRLDTDGGQLIDLITPVNVSLAPGSFEILERPDGPIVNAGSYQIRVQYQTNGTNIWENVGENGYQNPLNITIHDQGAGTLELNGPIAVTNPLVKGSPATFSVNLTNTGGQDWTGDVSLQLLSGSYIPLDQDNNITIGVGQTYSLFFSTNSLLSNPNTYEVSVVARDNSVGSWYLISPGAYQNPIDVTVNPAAGSLTIVQPNGGQTFITGQTLAPISWTSTGSVGNISIEIQDITDSDRRFVIADDIPNSSPYSGTPYAIPVCAVGDFRSKIYETHNPTAVNDFGDTPFNIALDPNLYSLTLTAPNTGGTFYTDASYPIVTWTSSQNFGNVSIELLNDQENTVAVLADGVADTGTWTPGPGDNFPSNLPTGNYRIKIYNTECGSLEDASDVAFTLNSSFSGTCSCTIDNPANGSGVGYTAAAYLCSECIIDDPAAPANDVAPQDNIIKEDLAKITFLALFGDPATPTYADNFPVPFFDMQGTEPYQRYGKVLSYLEYGDNIPPFTRDFANYRPGDFVTRGQLAKVYCEAFNIDKTTIFTPFTDLPVSHPEFLHIAELGNRGVLDVSSGTFRPNDFATREEAFIILYNILTQCSNCLDDALTDPMDGDQFFDPGNYTPENLGRHPGMAEGNFDSYSATGLFLPDRGIPLSFSISYNSYLTELPEEFFPYHPLGNGWVHTYHSYIVKVDGWNNSIGNVDPIITVVWSDGTMHAYEDDGSSSPAKITKGNYDDITYHSSGDYYTIKKKNQTVFRFERIVGATDAPYVLTEVKDRNNNTLSISHQVHSFNNQTLARIYQVTGTTGRKLQFRYHSSSPRIKEVEDLSLNRKVRFQYGAPSNPDTRLLRYFDAEDHETIYSYAAQSSSATPDTEGYFLLKQIKLPNGNFTTNNYQEKKLTASTTNNSTTNNQVQTDIDWSLNLGGSSVGTTSTISRDDGTTVRDYTTTTNALGRVTNLDSPTNDADILYDDNLNPTLPTSVTVAGLTTTYTYDTNGNVLTAVQEMGIDHTFTYNNLNDLTSYTNPRDKVTEFKYEDGLNLTKIEAPIGTSSITYHPYGLVKDVTNPEGITISYTYDAYGNTETMTAPLGISSTAQYDVGSRLKSFTNPNDQLTTYDYSDRNLITSVTNHLPNHPVYQQLTTGYGYDGNGNLTSITNARGNVTSLEYDYFDFLKEEKFGDVVRKYEYDKEGKLTKITRGDNNPLFYNYLDEGLLETDGYATYSYDSKFRLHKVKKDNKEVVFAYDNLNRITSVTYEGDAIQYEYDDNSNVERLVYPDGKYVDYAYDDNDRMKTVKDWNNQTTEYFYLLDGRMDRVTYPNGVETEYFYDDAGRLDSMVTQNGGNIICAYGFTLDNMGNHLQERKTEPFGYYTWTALSETDYAYNNRNEITAGGNKTFTHDNNGNIQTVAGERNLTLGWDNHDMLTSVSGDFSATYEYDGMGHRRVATRDGVTTRYQLDILGMSRILMEEDAGGNAQHYYVYGMNMISRVKPNGDTRYFHYDFRGSTVAMTDGSGTTTHQYAYDEYGECLQRTEEDFNPFRFVGGLGVMQEDTTLMFMRARYYDAAVGRFLSEDPIWNVNLYSYAEGNPSKYVDPNGEAVNLVAGGIGFAAGFVTQSAVDVFSGRGFSWGNSLRSGAVGGIAGLTMGASLVTQTAIVGGASLVSTGIQDALSEKDEVTGMSYVGNLVGDLLGVVRGDAIAGTARSALLKTKIGFGIYFEAGMALGETGIKAVDEFIVSGVGNVASSLIGGMSLDFGENSLTCGESSLIEALQPYRSSTNFELKFINDFSRSATGNGLQFNAPIHY